MASGTSSIFFTLSTEVGGNKQEKVFELKEGGVIRIGRSAVADFVVEHSGASQHHTEIRLVPGDGGDPARLCIRDLSSNGTGLKRADALAEAVDLPKNTDEPLENGMQLLVPMRLKKHHNARLFVTLNVHGQDDANNDASKVVAAGSSSRGKTRRAKTPSDAAAKGNAEAAGTPEEQEAARKRFVQLLLNAPGIHNKTTYPKAEKLLSIEPAWRACDEKTRKECFDILVENLGEPPHPVAGKSKSAAKEDGHGSGPDWEETCKRFAELLSKTREISGTTTYKQAEQQLSTDRAWRQCDDQTRKECFHHFVENLANKAIKKKDKKKKKHSDNDKVKEKKQEDDACDKCSPERNEKKRGRHSRSHEGGRADRSPPRNARKQENDVREKRSPERSGKKRGRHSRSPDGGRANRSSSRNARRHR